MKQYTGTNTLKAKPMTRQEYVDYRGWTMPADENPTDAGYLLEYPPDGKQNMSSHEGYVSWSPANVFEATYRESGLDITSQELAAAGKTAPRVTREQIEALMERVVYRTTVPEGTTTTFVHAFLDGTFFLATGFSACVSKENFVAAIGHRIAKEAAVKMAQDKLWELEGYALKLQLEVIAKYEGAAQ